MPSGGGVENGPSPSGDDLKAVVPGFLPVHTAVVVWHKQQSVQGLTQSIVSAISSCYGSTQTGKEIIGVEQFIKEL